MGVLALDQATGAVYLLGYGDVLELASSILSCFGTGASYGQWRMPWSPEERSDSIEIIDWITRQAWSNQQVSSMPCAHVEPHTLMSSCAWARAHTSLL